MHIWVVPYIYAVHMPYVYGAVYIESICGTTLVPGVPDPDPTGWNPYVATLVPRVLDPDPTGWNLYVATLVPGVLDPDPTGWNSYVATLVPGVLDPDPTGWNPYLATLGITIATAHAPSFHLLSCNLKRKYYNSVVLLV
jgi:hypothetical protein